jgi:F-type H+-transporting ATPase subunit delta
MDSKSNERQEQDARFAADWTAEVGVEHIAGVYAEAFLGAAKAAGRSEELLAEFDAVADALGAFPELGQILASSLVSHEEKVGIIDRTFGTQASPEMVNFLKVVSRHGRLDCLQPIHGETHRLYERAQGCVRVLVTTATALEQSASDRIIDDLRNMIDGKPILQQLVDPSLIGGVVVRVGDTVFDGSVATQLENVRQQMIDRSAHEIQSRRDRFRNPE